MNFIEKYKIPENEDEESVERSLLSRGDPLQNPDHWILVRFIFAFTSDCSLTPEQHASPVQAHTCFDGVDLPLLGVAKLLDQSLPENDDWTDFDVYQYAMYRPVALFAEFGGLVRQLIVVLSNVLTSRQGLNGTAVARFSFRGFFFLSLTQYCRYTPMLSFTLRLQL